MSKNRDRWARTGRDSGKLIKEVRRVAREKDIPISERQSGSHHIIKAEKGIVVIPDHGELSKGIYHAIIRTIKIVFLILLVAAVVYINL